MSESVAAPAVVEAPATAATAPDPEVTKKAVEAEQIRIRGLAIKQQRKAEFEKTQKERDELRVKAEEYEKKLADTDAWRKRALEDPEALKDIYGDNWYEALTKAKIGDDSNLQVRQAEQRFQEKIAALEAKLAERDTKLDAEKTAAQQAQSAEDTRVEQEWAEKTTQMVKEKAADFESINALGLQHQVAKRVKSSFESGKQITAEQAAQEIEAELDSYIKKVLASPKWQKKFVARTHEFDGPRFEAKRRSVGNDMTPSSATIPNRKPTREERKERSVKLLEAWEAGQKK